MTWAWSAIPTWVRDDPQNAPGSATRWLSVRRAEVDAVPMEELKTRSNTPETAVSEVQAFSGPRPYPLSVRACPARAPPGTSPSWLDPDCKDPRTSRIPAGASATFKPWLVSAVLASGSGAACSTTTSPSRSSSPTDRADAARHRRSRRRGDRAGRAHHLRCRFSTTVRRTPTRCWPRPPEPFVTTSLAIAAFCTVSLSENESTTHSPIASSTPVRRYCRRVQGLAHGVDDALTAASRARVHSAPRPARGRRRSECAGGGTRPPRRHRRDPARADGGMRTQDLSRSAPEVVE